MGYSWDEEKNRRNVARHGIAFKDAVRIFDGLTVERVDDRFEYGQVRVYAIGVVNGLEITVIYTDRDDDERRIISAWRADRMKDAITGNTSTPEPATDWERLRRLGVTEVRAGIDADPDARATDEAFWKDAKVVLPRPKETITMRLDADLLSWLRQERGYQTRINAILRAYMKSHSPHA